MNNVNNNQSGVTYVYTPETFLQDFAIDSNNNIVVVGSFRGRNVDFDPSAGVATFNSDIQTQTNPNLSTYKNTGYLWKLNSSGSYVWAGVIKAVSSSFVPSVDTFPYAITFDANDDFYFSGHFRSQIDLNPGSGTASIFSNGNSDVFIGKFSGTNNALIWARSFGGANNVYTNDMRISGNKLLLFGSFVATIDFDPNSGTQSVTSQGVNDSYLLSLTETSFTKCEKF
ncbi:MAG: hypothetical protein HC854_15835 [Flavobacterium sp.]|nr:hypothetical protein [Flavobacterium sp.]